MERGTDRAGAEHGRARRVGHGSAGLYDLEARGLFGWARGRYENRHPKGGDSEDVEGGLGEAHVGHSGRTTPCLGTPIASLDRRHNLLHPHEPQEAPSP